MLDEAINCALAQEEVALEVIVVDDGSLTPIVMSPDRKLDGGIVVLSHEQSRGDAAARNTGLAAARGVWTAFLDDDDLWAPNKLSSQLTSLSETVGAGYAYCGAVELDGQGGVIKDHPAPHPAEILELLTRRNVMPAGSSNVIARTALLRELGGFDTSFANLSDWDLWLRLARSVPAARSVEPLVGYRRHVIRGVAIPGELSSHTLLAQTDNVLEQLHALDAKHRSATPPLRPDVGSYVRWLVATGPRRGGRRFVAARLYLTLGLRFRSLSAIAAAGPVLLGEGVMERALGLLRQPAPPPAWLAARHPVLNAASERVLQ
jgi:hypothetical protein